MALKAILNSKENFVDLAVSIFKENKWSRYSDHKFKCPPRKPTQQSTNGGNLNNFYIEFSTNHNEKSKSKPQQFNRMESKEPKRVELSKQNINALMFTLVFYYSLKYFVEFHDVESIQIVVKKKMNLSYSDFYEKYEKSVVTVDSKAFVLNEDDHNRLDLNKSVKSNNSMTREGGGFYRKIFEDVTKIVNACRSIESRSPQIYSFFMHINSIRLY